MNDERKCQLQRGSRFLQDRRGFATIEFAMLGPAFLATMLGSFETSLDYYQTFQLDRAAQYAMRQIMIGNAPGGINGFRNIFCAQLPSTMDCVRVRLDVQVVTNFTSVDWIAKRLSPGSYNYEPGNPGDVVLLQAVYAAPVISPIWFTATRNFNVNGERQTVRILAINAVARNEKP